MSAGSGGPQLLLTGASGVLGCALRERLQETPTVCLAHRAAVDVEPPHQQLRGDLTQPRLGLGETTHRELLARTDVVVHAAATTDFGAEPEAIRRLNLEGTERVLEFADAAGASVIYISTAFVERLDGALAAGVDNDAAAGRNAYLESKRESERAVAKSGVPWATVRPSVVIGDSRSAEIARPQGLHMMLRAFCKGTLPFIPMGAASAVDFMPQDLVADSIAGLAALPGEQLPDEPVWLTAGEEAITVAQMAAICIEAMAAREIEAPPPRYFDQETLDRLIIPAFVETLPAQLRERLWNFLALTTLFSTARPFPSSLGRVAGVVPAASRSELAGALRRTVDRYCLPAAPAARVEVRA